MQPHDDERPDDDAGNDRRRREQHLRKEPDHVGEATGPVLGKVDRSEQPERDREDDGHTDDERTADERF